MTSELDNIRAGKDDINTWVDNTLEILKDIQNNPGKLRSDAAQVELNQLQDIRNVSISIFFNINDCSWW